MGDGVLYIHNNFTGWSVENLPTNQATPTTGICPATNTTSPIPQDPTSYPPNTTANPNNTYNMFCSPDLAVTIPAAAVFLSGATTAAYGQCPETTVTPVVNYPEATTVAALSDHVASTTDGKHIIGASANPPMLTDLSITVPIDACPSNGNAQTTGITFNPPPVVNQTSLAAYGITNINQVVAATVAEELSTELGGAPFALTIDGPYEERAREIGLDIAPGAFVYALPCIAGHVGADAAGVVLAEGPYLKDELTLLVDVGTNAEIVFGNRERLFACSSPTGPAFEGAQISCGQRAAPGAIERVRIDRETLEPRFKVIGCDLWSDEPGFAAATGTIGVTGVCGSGIIEAIAEMFLSRIVSEDGVIDGELLSRTKRVEQVGRTFAYVLHEGAPRLLIYQTDVRAIQLAKAALYAGAKLLIERAGATPERVTLAGAFGSHIDPAYAMTLGLIPDCDLAKVASAGNAAGTGARIALLNLAARAEIESVVRGIAKIETAIEPAFQRHFVAAMAFPNKEDAFPNLAKRVELPARKEPGGEGGRRRRRGAAAGTA